MTDSSVPSVSPPPNSVQNQKIKFHYIKGNFFHVAHVDGAIGGVTPSGDIFVSVYSQRGAIPQITVQPVTEAGELGPELSEERVSKEGIVREVEIGLVMHPNVAKGLMDWLREKLELVEKVSKSQGKGAS